MSTYTDASLIVTPNAKKAGKLYALKGADLDAVRATTATYVGSDGLIKTALANEPRFDYTNGSCPSILVEPQRTNLLPRSEEFDNAIWVKAFSGNGTAPVVTSNQGVSPDGTNNADRIIFSKLGNLETDFSLITFTFTTLTNQNYTSSVYLKSFNGTHQTVRFWSINLGTFVDVVLTNQWQRFNLTSLPISGTTGFFRFGLRGNSNNNADILAWGAQLEAGSNATSYIPTVASTVTRNADVISKTGISDLIGQTEGTIYADVDFNNSASKTEANRIIELTDGTNSNRIIVAFGSTNTLLIRLTASGVEQTSLVTSISVGMLKIALSYSSSGVKLYVNGTLRQSNLSASIPATNIMNLGYFGTTNLQQLNDGINSVILWKIKLTDQQCIELTTL